MKFPNKMNTGENINSDIENNSIQMVSSDVIDAESRAIAAQNKAIELRSRLENLEELLAKTKQNLAETNGKIELKDKEINKVQEQAHTLSKSLVNLEERFERLKVLRSELHNMRKNLGL